MPKTRSGLSVDGQLMVTMSVKGRRQMASDKAIRMVQLDDRNFTTDMDKAGYRKFGITFKVAETYEALVKLLDGEGADIVVVNMDHTKIDACAVCAGLKVRYADPKIPVVVTSVQTSAKVRDRALAAGADLFVVQPLPRDYFVEKIKPLLEKQVRTDARVEVGGVATVKVEAKKFECSIVDISSSGILLSIPGEIEDGTRVELSFEIPESKKPIAVLGEVVRTIKYSDKYPDRPVGMGVRFVEFVGDSEKRLLKYVKQIRGTDPRMVYYL